MTEKEIDADKYFAYIKSKKRQRDFHISAAAVYNFQFFASQKWILSSKLFFTKVICIIAFFIYQSLIPNHLIDFILVGFDENIQNVIGGYCRRVWVMESVV